jgi:hypothetical protein
LPRAVDRKGYHIVLVPYYLTTRCSHHRDL